MPERIIDMDGVRVPTFLYGTAWKEDATAGLVTKALAAGFRGIDTANQRKHYHEAAVGEAIQAAISRGDLKREDLFLQTKFTFRAGQDHRLPYDPEAPVAKQVDQSFESSLTHLGVKVVDSYVLHGPSMRHGLSPVDREAWEAMETLHDAGRTRLLGVSNVAPDQLVELLRIARVKPAFVQNRCFAELGWDALVREICDDHGIVYQGFSLLTANRRVLEHETVEEIARRHGRTQAEIVFGFALTMGMVPLTGTRNPAHMTQDLSVYDLQLTDREMRAIGTAGA